MSEVSLQRAADRFKTYLLTEKRVSSNTFSAYSNDIEQFVSFLKKEGSYQGDGVPTLKLKGFLHHLKKNRCGARTMSRKISSLKTFFAYMQKQYEWQNTAEDLTFPKLEKRLPQYLSEAEVQKLFKIATLDTTLIGVRNKIMLYLLYSSGMRISELTNLQLSHIHFDTNLIFVQGKGGKGRMVPMPDSISKFLKNYVNKIHKLLTCSKSGTNRKTEFLFPVYYSGKSKPISRQSFWIILKKLCQKANIKQIISPHKLRHSLATHMLKNGADLRSLQMLLGHESLSTVQIYTHVETSYLRSIYDKKHPRS